MDNGSAIKDRSKSDRKVFLQARIDRDTHFLAKALFRSHDLSLDKGVEWALRSLLIRAGIGASSPQDKKRREG